MAGGGTTTGGAIGSGATGAAGASTTTDGTAFFTTGFFGAAGLTTGFVAFFTTFLGAGFFGATFLTAFFGAAFFATAFFTAFRAVLRLGDPDDFAVAFFAICASFNAKRMFGPVAGAIITQLPRRAPRFGHEYCGLCYPPRRMPSFRRDPAFVRAGATVELPFLAPLTLSLPAGLRAHGASSGPREVEAGR
jgi:hypothetical protein